MEATQSSRLMTEEFAVAAIATVALVGGAFIAASLTQDQPLFSLSPPGKHIPDVAEPQRLVLHQTFFTAWAALVLVTPALCTFLFRKSSGYAARYWFAFWTASYLAFLIHVCWAIFVFFGNDWGRIFDKTRVSAPELAMVLVVWWFLDLALGWLMVRAPGWVRVQRIGVHLLAFGLFFAGSAKQGEILCSKVLGYLMLIAVVTAVVLWLVRWLKTGHSLSHHLAQSF